MTPGHIDQLQIGRFRQRQSLFALLFIREDVSELDELWAVGDLPAVKRLTVLCLIRVTGPPPGEPVYTILTPDYSGRRSKSSRRSSIASMIILTASVHVGAVAEMVTSVPPGIPTVALAVQLAL